MAIRLLQTDNCRMCYFMGDAVPEYAILSHTWGSEELSFQEKVAVEKGQEHPAAKKAGHQKVLETCRKAREDGIAYVWIDTCCIDKTSSSELSEAINSMYRWYQQARICYVSLADLDTDADDFETIFPKCRWFTRGWCLQELLAPSDLHFFDKHWRYVGSKELLRSSISTITKIPVSILIDPSLIDSVSIAERMSWAAERKTTRKEDIAYSLLGIFDVSMPFLYGEGSKAFLRLQEQIISQSNDRSIFAFTSIHSGWNATGSIGKRSSYQSLHVISLEDYQSMLATSPEDFSGRSRSRYYSLFATSPEDFSGCSCMDIETSFATQSEGFALTNKGLYFRRVKLFMERSPDRFSLPLFKYGLTEPKEVRMLLQKVGSGLFSKIGNRIYHQVHHSTAIEGSTDPIAEEEVYIVKTITPSIHRQLDRASEYAIHVRSSTHDISRAIQAIQRAPSSDRWDVSRMLFLTSGERPVRAHWKVFPRLAHSRLGTHKDGITRLQKVFYVVAGIADDTEGGEHPQAWVKIYSLDEWRSLEEGLGIITNLYDIASHRHGASTSCRMKAHLLDVTAAIQLQVRDGLPCFELTVNLSPGSKDSDFSDRN